MVYGNAVNYNMTMRRDRRKRATLSSWTASLRTTNGLAEFDSLTGVTGGDLQATITLAGSGSVPGAVTVPASAVQWHVNDCNAEQWESRMIRVDSLHFIATGNFAASH